MYTLLINEENQVICTKKETIMQRSSCVDKIQIFVLKDYKGIDLSGATVYMKYVLPRSRDIKITKLNIAENNFEDTHLKFIVPGDAALTSEHGNIEVSFTFIKPYSDGVNQTVYLRKTQAGFITITPIPSFENYVVDEMLNEVDQRLVALEIVGKNLEAQNQKIYENLIKDIHI